MQDQVTPAPEGVGKEGPQGQERPSGESSIQRLKRQRSEAMEAARRAEQRVAGLESKIETMAEALNRLSEARDPNSPKDYSEADLLNIATNQEYLADKPDVAMRAMATLLEKKLEGASDSIKKSVINDIEKLFTKRDNETTYAQRVGKLVDEFGEDNLSPGSELHDLAENIYKRYLLRYKDHSPEAIRDFRIWAVKEAAEELGLSPKPRISSETQKMSPEPLLEQGGAPQESEKAKVDSLLDKGDWRGAIREQMRQIFGG